ncbi:MAG: 8-amino-7-oxononanoate synthase [Candidatus Omnitrophota bacterium]|nr:8-amino-7-oxononanoate synthase [Candidatus Omnitrophota bacterium]
MHYLKKELEELEGEGLFRDLRLLDGPQEAKVIIGKKQLINLCSNNYLGLSNNEQLKKAAIGAVKEYGVGSGASRLICGNMLLHKKLEERIARFKKTESALVFNSGYSANLGVITSLVGKGDAVFSDRLNHASIVDAALLSGAEFKRYPHRDMEKLETLLKCSSNFRRRLIVSDSVFSMDGDLAPLLQLVSLAKKYDSLLYIDEAHATGVLGKKGRGALEYFGVEENDFIIQMGTLSKAIGSFGAYVCGVKTLIDYLINRARAFIYTTALPVCVCASSIAALDIIEGDCLLRDKLREKIKFFRDNLRSFGFSVSNDPTPIIPLLIGDAGRAMEFSRRLFEEGVFVQGIRPPTVPKGSSRLRITIMATHEEKDLCYASGRIANVAKGMGLI